jgi:zinc-ribbon domain
MSSDRLSFVCPVCGESVPSNAKACPECGACEKSGWSEDAAYDGLSAPEEDFDYDRFVADEFGGRRTMSRKEKFWWLVGVVVLVAFAWLILRGLFS